MSHPRTLNAHQPISAVFGLLILITFSAGLMADDIEVYLQPPPDQVPPNILFLLDESGSMDGEVVRGITRRDALVNALNRILNAGTLDNVNAALLGYSTLTDTGESVRLVAHTGDFTLVGDERASFRSAIDQLETLHYTPTTDALAAAVDWFHPDRIPSQIQPSGLQSPLTGDPEILKCAPNRIVLLSDGAPNTSTRTVYEGIPCAEVSLFDSAGRNEGARCSNEISAWAYNTDLATGEGWDGTQNILTYTLSFGTTPGSDTQRYMNRVARSGGGESWIVANEDEIAEAFSYIINEAQNSIRYVMNAPTIPFNPDNAAVSEDVIFVPLFYPDARRFWHGNLKKYNVNVTDDEIELRARGGQRVLNDDHTFASTIDLFCDHRSCEPDEGDPLVGGAASNMTGLRNLYTNLDHGHPLNHQTNRVHRDTANITNELLDVSSEEERIQLLNWITRDPAYIATEEQPSLDGVMGAPIHPQPVVVDYDGQGRTVYIPTSEGVLEAIDAETGEELWAFMPQDLLRNIRQLRNNEPSVTPYYGLDGPLTVYETDGRKMAIVGMRRGGRKYHLLDISDRRQPVYVSEISADAAPTEFSNLGQTWSKPLFATMWINNAEREVLIFGGGYDPDQDNGNGADDEGNAIYVVDAADGSLLISVSNSGASLNINDMENAIPSNLATVDINGNGIVDRIYAADVGGRIIRADFEDRDRADNALSGGIIADINQGANAHRKFFTTPQVGYYSKGAHQFLALLIGTGDHADPLETHITDRFYMIKDGNIWDHAISQQPAVDNDFINASTTALVNGEVLTHYRGWYINFEGSEKSFSRAILYDYSIFFTTYSAERVVPDEPCEVEYTRGTARIYGLDLISANAAVNWNGITEHELTISDRSSQLRLQGIPPSPMLFFPGGVDDNGDAVIGRRIFLFADLQKKHEWSDRFRPIYWEEVIED
ncbi:MAG: hypothetical protein ABW098_09975 [Candidatus Thiodiazotropha sp.]